MLEAMEQNTLNTSYTAPAAEVEYSIPYILRQIAAIQADTAYLHEAIRSLGNMSDGDSGEPDSPGNAQGALKAESFGKVVTSREATNQRILSIYEKMYDELIKAK